jgi:phosphopantetheinyl transferase
MPLYKTIAHTPDIEVYLWKVAETETDLLAGLELTQNSKERYLSMRSAIHRRGFLSIRHLLMHAGYKDCDLTYDSLGKPHLSDGTYISISHSFEFTGIILSKLSPVGIDIEKHRDKILRISKRFVSPKEDVSTESEQDRIIHLTRIWGAKEAIYKIMGVPGLRFLDQIKIDYHNLNNNAARGQVAHSDTLNCFTIFFADFEGYTLGYAIQE